MGLYSFYRISKPSKDKVSPGMVETEYKRLRARTFWGVTVSYALYYVCRMTLSVAKQPLIDEGVFSASQLGMIGSAMLFVYAFGKFFNGLVADYCNIRRFMLTGLLVSATINLAMGFLGLLRGWAGVPSILLFLVFAAVWGMNGWVQSMGSPPGVISLSRWFPLSRRGTFYSIFSATPYLGNFLSFIITGLVVGWAGWEYGFLFSSLAGLVGVAVVFLFVSDTPESRGLPSVQELSGEEPLKTDRMPTKVLQKMVVRNPGLWIIALSSAFVYITQYAVSGWGVLFLQKEKGFTLASATQIIAFSEAFGIAGTVLAGWLSDRMFKGDRLKPVLFCGLLGLVSLAAFLFSSGGYAANIALIALFSLSIGVVYCTVAGLMALDIVPRKATGAALGIVGISSYVAAAIQDLVSGFLIGGRVTEPLGQGVDCDFGPVSWFWLAACLLSFAIPVAQWRRRTMKEAG